MGKTIRIGIVGCGGIAIGKHLPSLHKLPDVELCAFFDLNEKSAKNASERFGTPDSRVYASFDELIADDRLDVVHICTPNSSHADFTIRALRAGKHVMCEKPMATTAAEAWKMVETARECGRKLTIGFQNRYRADAQYLYKLCQDGKLGDIYFAKAHAVRRRAVPTWGVFLNSELQGGGPLIDIGSHSLDLALWMMNNYDVDYVVGNVYNRFGDRPDCGNVFGSWDPKRFRVEDSAFAMITMKNGATVTLESSWALNTIREAEAKVTLCGDRAGADMLEELVINGDENGRLYSTYPVINPKGVDYYAPETESAADLEMRLWIECLQNDTQPVVLPEQAATVAAILEAVYESSRTHAPVYLNRGK